VIDRIATGKNNTAEIIERDALLAKLFARYTLYSDKRGKLKFDLVFSLEIKSGT
jgi:hypothetical protein